MACASKEDPDAAIRERLNYGGLALHTGGGKMKALIPHLA